MDAETTLSTAHIKKQLKDCSDIQQARVRPRDRARALGADGLAATGRGPTGVALTGAVATAAAQEGVKRRMKAPTLPGAFSCLGSECGGVHSFSSTSTSTSTYTASPSPRPPPPPNQPTGLSDDLVEGLLRQTMAIGELTLPIAPAPPTPLHGPSSPAAATREGASALGASDMEIEQARAGGDGSASRRSVAGGRDSLPLAAEGAAGRLSLGVKEEGGEEDMMMLQDDDFRMDDDYMPPPEEDEAAAAGAGALSPSKLEGEEELLEEDEEEGEGSEEAASSPGRGQRGEEEEEVAFTWHPNTVKILTFLRRQIKGKRPVSLKKLAAEASRTNVAKFFWELLQLKTWDFITLEQPEAYGDIVIGPGKRFRDEIVSAAPAKGEEGSSEDGSTEDDEESEAREVAA